MFLQYMFRLALICCSILIPSPSSFVVAQYSQRYRYINASIGNGQYQNQFWWQPNALDLPQQVVILNPTSVFLEYNCYYMKDICKNAENFISGPRGLGQRLAYIFAYDFDTVRKSKRRDKSCSDKTWKKNHPCPEPDQQTVMRHDGAWPYTDLEDSTGTNYAIKHRRDSQNNIVEYSSVSYSCDEFPPATWIEGGSGLLTPLTGFTNGHLGGHAETRCAAIRCGQSSTPAIKIKAEQDWQATSHGILRNALQRAIDDQRQLQPGAHPGWTNTNGVVFFGFRMVNTANTIAAKVITVDGGRVTRDQGISQAKRSADTVSDLEWMGILGSANIDDLKRTGNFTEEHILADETNVGEMPVMDGMTESKYGTILNMAQRSNEFLDNHVEPQDRDHHAGSKSGHSPATPLFSRSNASDVDLARQTVQDAIARSAELNRRRLAHPMRNTYQFRRGQVDGSTHKRELDVETGPGGSPRLLDITDDLADAAALVSEADAVHMTQNVTRREVAAQETDYWMGKLDRMGSVPWGNDSDYKVFRNVRDYGAIGDGLTDDTKAIKRAMNDGNRCGEKCHGSTTKNAIIYFPPGEYRVSSTIPLPFGTQVIGDATRWPTIVAASCFLGLGVLSTNEYTGNGFGPDGQDQQWFITNNNFYRQIRNLRIDITSVPASQRVAALHYQVAQATSIQHVEIVAGTGTTQIGIFAENGSGGTISDITFKGGAFGIFGGTQQFTAQRLTFDGCTTGAQVIWDWGWMWKSIKMTDIDVGFRLLREGVTEEGHVGSASFIDSTFTNVSTAILIAPPNPTPGSASTGIVMDNVRFQNVEKALAAINGETLIESQGTIRHWALGPVYSPHREYSTGANSSRTHKRPDGLIDSSGAYFERTKPQYQTRNVRDFVHVKDFGARGDGKTDDTEAFQEALSVSQGKILFVDAGSYILTRTVTVPLGSKVVGEAWSQLVASGPFFEDERNPQVMLKVGKPGDVGSIEMQDLLFTSRGGTAGLVLVEWNVRAESAGSAGLWDCHVRVGGALETDLTDKECPANTTEVNPQCKAASLMMHITPKASGYFENMWLWAADHMIDDDDLTDANNTVIPVSVYAARGLLIESQEPTWLYGTSSEHASLYQYNFNKARKVFAGMIQSESPYYQGGTKAPSPFQGALEVLPGDPISNVTHGGDLQGSVNPWALVMRQSADVLIAGAGLYSFFSSNSQECVDEQSCQNALALLENNYGNVQIQHIITIGAEHITVQDGYAMPALDNLHVQTHPRWSYISVFDVGDGQPWYLEIEKPQFTCAPPCLIQLPPWTRATSTIDYPRITVTDGTWRTTITEPPMTISNWAFEVLTVTKEKSGANKRQAANGVVPALAEIAWPNATYTGQDGEKSTTAPNDASPSLPNIFGQLAVDPPEGQWPDSEVEMILGDQQFPVDDECVNGDLICVAEKLGLGGIGPMVPADDPYPDDEYDENADIRPSCPVPETTTSSPTTTSEAEDWTPTWEPEPEPEPSPYEDGDPSINEVSCNSDGRKSSHERIDNAIKSYCNSLAEEGDMLYEGFEKKRQFEFPVINLETVMAIEISFKVWDNCQWEFTWDECRKYLLAPIDSCQCGGKDGKRGGTVENNCYTWIIDPYSVL